MASSSKRPRTFMGSSSRSGRDENFLSKENEDAFDRRKKNVALGHLITYILEKKYNLIHPEPLNELPVYFTDASFHALFGRDQSSEEEDSEGEEGAPTPGPDQNFYQKMVQHFDRLETHFDQRFDQIKNHMNHLRECDCNWLERYSSAKKKKDLRTDLLEREQGTAKGGLGWGELGRVKASTFYDRIVDYLIKVQECIKCCSKRSNSGSLLKEKLRCMERVTIAFLVSFLCIGVLNLLKFIQVWEKDEIDDVEI
ncbi:hypothetical protein IEQ34_017908 [Dendrobium chrysotoxum]|uniref:Uncharacterized protein n=1 Tax=Dendrobium chrysotoxum TaxID=161865 RepID=A0AAV7FVB8_DENCH|nr:hypothetical protein IEQ34_017908 [Dendrobium chrysotoxum]